MRSRAVEPKVRNLLAASRDYRNSDKKLLMAYWESEGLFLTHEQRAVFMSCTPAESITRARRTLRPQYPGDKEVEEGRYENFKQETLDHSKGVPQYG